MLNLVKMVQYNANNVLQALLMIRISCYLLNVRKSMLQIYSHRNSYIVAQMIKKIDF